MIYYNTGAKPLPLLKVEDVVQMRQYQHGDKKWKKAFVKEKSDFQSYMISVNRQIY